MLGNSVARRFRFNNLVIAEVGAVVNLAVDVAVPSGTVQEGDVGFAVPVTVIDGGIPAIIPCIATSATNVRMFFTNASAGAINPADTHDFNAVMFPNVGNVITVG